MSDPRPAAPKPRKPRPSRARGLRTTTGCLTCRKRRVKCDEGKPRCGQCLKSERECSYGPNPSSISTATGTSSDGQEAPQSTPSLEHHSSATSVASVTSPAGKLSISDSPELRFDWSPSTVPASLPSPNSAPFEWYDLLAEDAVNNIQRHNLGFDEGALSRRQSPVHETEPIDPQLESANQATVVVDPEAEPWNSVDRLQLTDNEVPLFQHFIDVLGPLMDLFDPRRHFTMLIPRIAVHNLGVLKSLLAVAARHKALYIGNGTNTSNLDSQKPGSTVSSTDTGNRGINPLARLAVQYYYETLHYLSQNLLYPSYNKSGEIIATAILISTYEMFDAEGSYSNGDWERHLHGIFWIQRAQNNNGESVDGLRRAAWWAWLRQDLWVAFRESRRTLTIWRPTKRLMALTPDELALRVVYIAARCVDFAANEKQYDINIRIEQGDKLLQALEDWHHALPSTFQPIYAQAPSDVSAFSPIWIHPPSHAAAIQTFHFARIVVLINQPSIGGMNEFRQRQRHLDESVDIICGIAMMHQEKDLSSSFVDVMSVYAAGLCVQNPARQSALLQLLEKCLDISKFPPKTLLDDMAKYWREES